MFCPQCGAENLQEPKYCRHCGLSLIPVQMAVEGHVDHSIAQLKRAERALTTGAIFVALYSALVLFGLALGLFKGAIDYARLLAIPAFMLVVGVPYVLWGTWQLIRLIQPLKDKARPLTIDDSLRPWGDALLPTIADKPARKTLPDNRVMEIREEKVPAPVSLFDFTTDNLEVPKR